MISVVKTWEGGQADHGRWSVRGILWARRPTLDVGVYHYRRGEGPTYLAALESLTLACKAERAK